MYLTNRVSRFVAFVRAGYPTDMPATGYVALAALLPRRVCDDEITAITSELITHGRWPVSPADVGVAITGITKEMPSTEDIERVQRRLDATGCPRG
jgi:Protein of unknown function (DUF3349)